MSAQVKRIKNSNHLIAEGLLQSTELQYHVHQQVKRSTSTATYHWLTISHVSASLYIIITQCTYYTRSCAPTHVHIQWVKGNVNAAHTVQWLDSSNMHVNKTKQSCVIVFPQNYSSKSIVIVKDSWQITLWSYWEVSQHLSFQNISKNSTEMHTHWFVGWSFTTVQTSVCIKCILITWFESANGCVCFQFNPRD